MRIFVGLMLLAMTLRCYAQWAENKHRVELTDRQVIELHQAQIADRAADDELRETQERIRRECGEDLQHSVELYNDYCIVTDIQGDQQ